MQFLETRPTRLTRKLKVAKFPRILEAGGQWVLESDDLTVHVNGRYWRLFVEFIAVCDEGKRLL